MISVAGGTYREINFDDLSSEIYGSGFRGTKFLLENSCEVKFYTSGNKVVSDFLLENVKVYNGLNLKLKPSEMLITFQYNFALDEPKIFPSGIKIMYTDTISIVENNLICFGMLESNYQIKAQKVVYDPQTSNSKIGFKEFGVAQELIYILNFIEAKTMSDTDDLKEIKKYFFEVQGVKALIIKNGPYGAKLFYDEQIINIPSFITESIHKIGSGDIFTTSFGYYWMKKELPLETCAINASKTTALFCDRNAFIDVTKFPTEQFTEFNPVNLEHKQVYLASPFFSLSELVFVDSVRTAFQQLGLKVFSPFHDVGIGSEKKIADEDIAGLDDSDIIFCILDNFDPGTLIEAGYAIASNKKIIGYLRNYVEKDILMFKLRDIEIYNNLTTAIYKTIWAL